MKIRYNSMLWYHVFRRPVLPHYFMYKLINRNVLLQTFVYMCTYVVSTCDECFVFFVMFI